MAFCSNCGAHLDGRFCSNCGHAAAETAEPSAPAVLITDPRIDRAYKIWRLGLFFVWAIVAIEMIFISASRPPEQRALFAVMALIGASAVLLVYWGLAYWEIGGIKHGSNVARRIFQFGWVALGAVRFLIGIASFGTSPIAALDTLAGLGQLVAWGYAAYLLQNVALPERAGGEQASVVRLKTEIPSFVVTVALLVLGMVQFAHELAH